MHLPHSASNLRLEEAVAVTEATAELGAGISDGL